jgi:hypothetical protein
MFKVLLYTCQHAELLPCIELAFLVGPDFLLDLLEAAIEISLISYEGRRPGKAGFAGMAISYAA